MITIISPSKTLNENPELITQDYTLPDFLVEAGILVEKLRKYSPKKLQKLMNINPKLAELNASRFIEWDMDFTQENANRAVLMFNGEVFNGLQAMTLNEEDLRFAQDHMRILSGLYGVLRPLDLMKPYRLEMGTNISIQRKKNLYQFWGDKLSQKLNEELERHDEKILLNLASDEYFDAINPKMLKAKIIKCQFKEERNGKLQFVTIFGKKARGLMLRFIIENRIDNYEDLKAFDLEGYYFNSNYSSEDMWIFSR
ncbi:MAG: peroxide stress protein YaaA [Bacteroidales bacterium]|nr:peroxide stress protein YaaA [Bacteroidales bacterium]MCF8390858.1 peroxide stress protein YaaA [Bacteroidales bacterium]